MHNLKKYIPELFILFMVCYLLFLIHPALLGQLGGTFKATSVPRDYTELEQFLSSQPNFFRTFWVPTTQRFGFYSNIHPYISASDYFNVYDLNLISASIKKQKTEKELQEASVKYLIVPYDSEGEIFLKDRKYDNQLYLDTITSLKKISWLKQINGFGKIVVFEVPNPKDHFFLVSNNGSVNYKIIDPTTIKVQLKNVRKGDRLVFSDSYDPLWKGSVGNISISSSKYELFNSFTLPTSGTYIIVLHYQPQEWVVEGLAISFASLILFGSLLTYLIFKARK